LRSILNRVQTAQAMGSESLRIIDRHSFEQNVAGLRQALHHVAPDFPAKIQELVAS
jgi:hypothetical protein